MIESQNQAKPRTSKKIWVFILVALVVLVSWTGLADGYAESLIDSAILDAGLLYGSARAVNGLVSVIQSVDISVIALSMSPGELLDPINDLVERFSSVMTLAIASLALQKILLYILDHSIFSIILTLSGLTVIYAQMTSSHKLNLLIKVFLTLALVRLSLTFIIMANTAVDAVFLEEHAAEDIGRFKTMQTSLSDVADSIGNGGDEIDLQVLEERKKELLGQKTVINQDIERTSLAIEELETEISQLQSEKSMLDRYNPLQGDPEVEKLNRSLDEYEAQMDSFELSRGVIDQSIEQIDEQVECADIRSKGGTCSIGEWIDKKTSFIDIDNKLEGISTHLEETVQGILNLIMLAILKSVLLPLLFWWLIIRSVKWVWREPVFVHSSDGGIPEVG